jgi:cytidylate kinase
MSIILISSDHYETGRAVAQQVAEATGYALLDREILGEVASASQIPEPKIRKSLEPSSSTVGFAAKVKNRALAAIQGTVMARLLDDKVVCHGLAAHLYVLGVSHVLKIRILCKEEERVSLITAERKVGIEKARKLLKKQEAAEKRWSLDVFGRDETNPSQYDMVISLSQIEPDEAVNAIVETVSYRKFQSMTYSIKCLRDKELSIRVKLALMEKYSDVDVTADGTTVVVRTKALRREKRKKTESIRAVAEQIPGVSYVEVHMVKDIFRQAAESA